MKNLIKIISFLSFLSFYTIEAQVVVKKDTLNGTVLTMTMDSKVKAVLTELEGKCDKEKMLEASKNEAPKVEISTKAKTNSEICRDNPKILGYKIQVAIVKSNEEANKVKTYFRSKFPNIKAETDASLRPNYKILVGSYFNKQSASSDLSRIRSYFPEAISVQYRVFCVEAK